MDSYKIKLILIAINVLININNSHAECIDSLNQFGYNGVAEDTDTGTLLNYFELVNRIIFVNDGLNNFENTIEEKKKKCSTTLAPNYERACSELSDAQKCLFKEADNNWVYLYECAILTKIYKYELFNAQKWCNEYAVEETSKKDCIDELNMDGLIFENGINNYFFLLFITHDYHLYFHTDAKQLKTKDVSNYLKINANNNSSNAIKADEKTQNVIIEEKQDYTLEFVTKWCKLNAMTIGTNFIKKKRNILNIDDLNCIEQKLVVYKSVCLLENNRLFRKKVLSENYRNEIIKKFINICTDVLKAKGYTNYNMDHAMKENYSPKYKKYIFKNFHKVIKELPPTIKEWCQENQKLTNLEVTAAVNSSIDATEPL